MAHQSWTSVLHLYFSFSPEFRDNTSLLDVLNHLSTVKLTVPVLFSLHGVLMFGSLSPWWRPLPLQFFGNDFLSFDKIHIKVNIQLFKFSLGRL